MKGRWAHHWRREEDTKYSETRILDEDGMPVGTAKVFFDGNSHWWRFTIQFMDNNPPRQHIIFPNLERAGLKYPRMDDAKDACDVILKEYGFHVIKEKFLAMQ